VADADVSDKELAMAEQLVESLAGEWSPEKYHDTYREQVMEMIEAKASGDTDFVVATEAPPREKVVDLMAALEASVAEAKEARGRHPTAGEGEKKKPARKPAAKKKSA
jgi:DNA end-binding protein Ku